MDRTQLKKESNHHVRAKCQISEARYTRFSHPKGPQGLTVHSPKVFALAAAEHTDQEGDNDNSTEHRQGDYQRLEVHCRQTQSNTRAKLFSTVMPSHTRRWTEVCVAFFESSSVSGQLKAPDSIRTLKISDAATRTESIRSCLPANTSPSP